MEPLLEHRPEQELKAVKKAIGRILFARGFYGTPDTLESIMHDENYGVLKGDKLLAYAEQLLCEISSSKPVREWRISKLEESQRSWKAEYNNKLKVDRVRQRLRNERAMSRATGSKSSKEEETSEGKAQAVDSTFCEGRTTSLFKSGSPSSSESSSSVCSVM